MNADGAAIAGLVNGICQEFGACSSAAVDASTATSTAKNANVNRSVVVCVRGWV